MCTARWTTLILLALASPLLAGDEAKPRRPNVVLIVADDLGYADVGFTGCKDVPTPHIDSIASGGVRLTNGYVSCCVCSPTRAGLMTGRYQQRFGHEFNTGGIREDTSEIGLPTSETTIADVLAKAGYVTGAVGKWHLGAEEKFHPLSRGFGEFFGFLGGGRSYLDRGPRKKSPILRGRETVAEKLYLTDAFGHEAESFVKRHGEEPFFLYLAFNAVHTPMEATPGYLARFPEIEPRKRRTYAAMLSAMDDAIGRVLAALREAGIDEDTLVVFFSDNGGPPRANGSRNDPLRGGKGTMYEGGIRVPFAMRWKGKLPAGAVYGQPVISLDVLPTAAAAAGAKVPARVKLDGVDLLPHLLGKAKGRPHESLCWRMGDRFAIRHGDLKLLKDRGGGLELYDLAADVSESKDLAGERKRDLTRLAQRYVRWEKGTVKPRWSKPVRNRRRPRR